MKHIKKILERAIPITLIVVLTMAASLFIYHMLIETEKNTCWERLEVATKNTADRIRTRMQDNLIFLELVADSLVVKQGLLEEEQMLEYLEKVSKTTLYERLDVLYPDGRLLLMTGESIQDASEFDYEELLAGKMRISKRHTDPYTGKEVVCALAPVKINGSEQAILIGMIDCQALVEQFTLYSYDGQTQIFLIDLEDGAYLLDNWHEELGNIYETGRREPVDGFEAVNFAEEMAAGKTGRAAYVSGVNGQNSYTYYMPIEEFNWELGVAAQEEMVLVHMHQLQDTLRMVGVVEVLFLFIYYMCIIYITVGAVKSEEKAQGLELERRANEAKARFLSNISHDIRTPLNGIVGMLKVIQNHFEDKTLVEDCLGKIDISTQYLITLANDVLEINEMESGKLVLSEETVDLRKLADDISTLMLTKAKDAGVSYRMDYSKIKDPMVIGSEVHIQRILINLIGNAIKYTAEKNGTVWVTFSQTEKFADYGFYRFEIQDNGIGMSEEFQKNMFNAFEQEKVNARSKYEGYGLGLTIVNRLVHAMDGKIEIESRKGEGSTFVVTLPLKFSKEQKKTVHEEIVDLKNARILLAEDNELNMEIAQILLSDAGAEVTPAMNGREAFDLFRESAPYSFDVILMDLMMPEMDGYEATLAIRGLDKPDAKTIPIIAMTASTFTEEINRCKKVGMNEHIAKPLNVDTLMHKVSRHYHRSAQESDNCET